MSHICVFFETRNTTAELDCLGNSLSGFIPDALSDLSSLQILELGENFFSSSIPSSVGNLTALASLSIYQNFLSGPFPSELGQLVNLEILRLNNNQIAGGLPAELGNMIALGKYRALFVIASFASSLTTLTQSHCSL